MGSKRNRARASRKNTKRKFGQKRRRLEEKLKNLGIPVAAPSVSSPVTPQPTQPRALRRLHLTPAEAAGAGPFLPAASDSDSDEGWDAEPHRWSDSEDDGDVAPLKNDGESANEQCLFTNVEKSSSSDGEGEASQEESGDSRGDEDSDWVIESGEDSDEDSEDSGESSGEDERIYVTPSAPKSISEGMPTEFQIVHLASFVDQIEAIGRHPLECTGGRFFFQRARSSGVGATYTFFCNTCNTTRRVYTHGRDKHSHAHTNELQNDSLAWGATSIGVGYSQTEEMFSVMGLPMLSKRKYKRHEEQVGKTWRTYVDNMCRKNGEYEYALAKERKQIVRDDDGLDTDVMYTGVIGDAGWAKRAYGGKNMNSAAGVGILIGELSMKPLFLDTRSTLCSTCSYAERKGVEPAEHECNRNFHGPATSTEQDIIVAGFNKSVEEHRLEYRFYIGDGDSSTYPQIRAKCHYGRHVMKLHCANHVTVRLSDHLHGLLKKTREYPVEARALLKSEVVGQLGQPQTRIERLVKGVRTAIRACGDREGNVASLQADLQNAPFHAFGRHDNCGDWCPRRDSQVPEKDEVEVAKQGGLFKAIQNHIQTLIMKSDSLVLNVTTNAAENFMSLVAKTNGGKRTPFYRGGSYRRRVEAALMSSSKGPGFHLSPMKLHSGVSSSPPTLKSMCQRRDRHCKRRREARAAKRASGERPSKNRRGGTGPDRHYGHPEAHMTTEERLALHPDLSDEALQGAKEAVLARLAGQVCTEEKRAKLIGLTGQHRSAEYRLVRNDCLLPSSKFGVVLNRLDTTPCDKLVQALVYPSASTGRVSEPMQYGIDNEETAVQEYVREHGVSEAVEQCGLYINPKWPFLASTPDRLLGAEGLIEVKCIFPGTLAKRGIDSFRGAAAFKHPKKSSFDFCLEVVDGDLHLKRKHNYYYQIQGQLAITERQYCVLVVFTDSSRVDNWQEGVVVKDLFVEKIRRDEELWNAYMLDKLTRFYMDCMLVEICLRRKNRGLPCKDPHWILQAQADAESKRAKNQRRKQK